jgi:hypothetical protein
MKRKQLCEQGFCRIAGVDEAGRGLPGRAGGSSGCDTSVKN